MNKILILFFVLLPLIVGFSVQPHNSVALNKDNHAVYIKTGNIFVIYVNDVKRYEHFVDLYHELSEVSFNEGNKNLKFGVLDCSSDSQLCDELQVKRNLELQYYGDSNQWKTLNDFLAKTINDVLKEDVTIAKFDQPGSMCVLFKIVSCPYCQEALQQWTRVESYYENSTRIHAATFDCTRHRSYCHRFNVRRYPAILYIENTSDGLQQFDKFNEDRTSLNIIHYCDRMYRTKRDSSL